MNRTAIVLTAAGAVAATAITAAALAGPDRPARENPAPVSVSETPSPSASPTPSEPPSPSATQFTPAGKDNWLTAIPDDLSVSEGLPEAGGDYERVSEPVTWSFCGTPAFPVGKELDARRVGATGPEYGDRRDLRAFPDDRAAHAFLTRATDAAHACPEEEHGATRWIHAVSPAGLGEESVRVVQTYETDGMTSIGATWWVVTRVGNAVLLTATGGEYLPGETLGQGIREYDELLAPIVDSMCVFSPAGCGSADDIPDDFPLAAGWPADEVAETPDLGLAGPNRTLEPPSWNLCDQPFTATGFRDRLRAEWTNVEDFRGRELLTFDDADQAVAFTASFVDYWESCPTHDAGDDNDYVQAVRRTEVGGESWALASWATYDGAPTVGLSVTHVIRLGRSVLIDTTSNEGSRPYLDRQIRGQAESSDPVVAAMCRFTEAGCGASRAS